MQRLSQSLHAISHLCPAPPSSYTSLALLAERLAAAFADALGDSASGGVTATLLLLDHDKRQAVLPPADGQDTVSCSLPLTRWTLPEVALSLLPKSPPLKKTISPPFSPMDLSLRALL